MSSVFDQLNREWAALVRRRPVAPLLSELCRSAGVSDPAGLAQGVLRADADTADQVLVRLVEASKANVADADRILLQLLLPGTKRLASKWWALGCLEERSAAAVTAVYSRIRNYPLERRPRRIAANILLDANQDLNRLARKVAADREALSPWDHLERHLAEVIETPAGEELRELVEDAVNDGTIPGSWAALIIATRVQGHDLPSIARRMSVPLRTLQWRRRSAELALTAGVAA